jgi:hypothetical protein
MNLEKYSQNNQNKNATNIHQNSLQYEVHSYKAQVLRKTQQNSPHMCNTIIIVLPKIAWPNTPSPH